MGRGEMAENMFIGMVLKAVNYEEEYKTKVEFIDFILKSICIFMLLTNLKKKILIFNVLKFGSWFDKVEINK